MEDEDKNSGKMKYITILIFCLIFLLSCDDFERKFYHKIDNGQINAIKNGFDIFDLSTITDFEWDSVFLVIGNESVPVFKEEIDEMLNDKRSNIHWENRKVEGRWHIKDLPLNRDRFYFLTPNKELVVKEIKSGIHEHKPAFDMACSCCEVDIHNFIIHRWLSKQECKFKLFSNTQEIGKGTVWLHVNCID